jgi:hypothetical protein
LKGKTMLAQFNSLSVKDQGSMLKELRSAYAANRAAAKAAKADARLQKQQAKALKQEQAIIKAQARLQKLLEKQAKPVGTKAIKAAKRPSKAMVLKGQEAANAVA